MASAAPLQDAVCFGLFEVKRCSKMLGGRVILSSSNEGTYVVSLTFCQGIMRWPAMLMVHAAGRSDQSISLPLWAFSLIQRSISPSHPLKTDLRYPFAVFNQTLNKDGYQMLSNALHPPRCYAMAQWLAACNRSTNKIPTQEPRSIVIFHGLDSRR